MLPVAFDGFVLVSHPKGRIQIEGVQDQFSGMSNVTC